MCRVALLRILYFELVRPPHVPAFVLPHVRRDLVAAAPHQRTGVRVLCLWTEAPGCGPWLCNCACMCLTSLFPALCFPTFWGSLWPPALRWGHMTSPGGRLGSSRPIAVVSQWLSLGGGHVTRPIAVVSLWLSSGGACDPTDRGSIAVVGQRWGRSPDRWRLNRCGEPEVEQKSRPSIGSCACSTDPRNH